MRNTGILRITYYASRMPSLAALANGDRHGLQHAATEDRHRNLLADPVADQQRLQVVGVLNLLLIQPDQDIADQQTTLARRAVRLDADDQQARLLAAPGPLALGQEHGLAADAQEAALDRTMLGQGIGGA